MKAPFIIIGSGLSGMAAAIRFARFFPDVILLEQHSRIGGLNSYYYRNKSLFETGLHAITNYAEPADKKAPLNKLLRQLKLSRKELAPHEQLQSEILFINQESLRFSNNFDLLRSEIEQKFPQSKDGFHKALKAIDQYDPFSPKEFRSTRSFLKQYIDDELLIDMLLCPLMYYGSSVENDMDLYQFVIMFRSLFQEGMFRPRGTIKDFLTILQNQLATFGGELKLNTKVVKIHHENKHVTGVELESGEILACDSLLSTIGHEETLELLSLSPTKSPQQRLGFVESIFQVPMASSPSIPKDTSIIFYNQQQRFYYERPKNMVSYASGVICFPANFENMPKKKFIEIRATHLANYTSWKNIIHDRAVYQVKKEEVTAEAKLRLEKIIGNFRDNIVYEETFTPLTIERYTAKKEGAIYGSPNKVKDGDLGYNNLFLAGTDQGLLGIVGSMLSGVTMVNQHILPKF